MGRKTSKKKRIQIYALLGALAILAIAMGVLLGGKISGVLFSGQDLFVTDPQVARPLPHRRRSLSLRRRSRCR